MLMTKKDIVIFCRSIGIKGQAEFIDEPESTIVSLLVPLSFGNLLRMRKLHKLIRCRMPMGILLRVGFYHYAKE